MVQCTLKEWEKHHAIFACLFGQTSLKSLTLTPSHHLPEFLVVSNILGGKHNVHDKLYDEETIDINKCNNSHM